MEPAVGSGPETTDDARSLRAARSRIASEVNLPVIVANEVRAAAVGDWPHRYEAGTWDPAVGNRSLALGGKAWTGDDLAG